MSDGNVINLGVGAKRRKTKDSSTDKQGIRCSFCGRYEDEVLKMVKGPNANICSECIMVSIQYLILKDSIPNNEAQSILDAFWKSKK